MIAPWRRGSHGRRRAIFRGFSGSVVIGLGLISILAMPWRLTASLAASDVRAETMFRELEEKLLAEKSLRLRFKISSEGPVSALLQGQLRLKSGNRVEIDVSGTYQSKPVKTRFESDGKKMHWTAIGQQFELETPKALSEAFIVGFTRMGLLHNLSALLGGEPPDHCDGGVADWVQVSDFLFAAPDPSIKLRGRSIRFEIAVEGKNAGEAEFWISPFTRVPVERRQTVHLKTGDLKVAESYEFLE